MKWYKVGVKFTEQQEDGTFKRVTKQYLLQGESFTDVEHSAYEKLKKQMRGTGEVVSMKRVNVHMIIEGDSDTFYELKISFMQADESGRKEKKITHNIFMRADSAEDAVTGLRKHKDVKKSYPYYNLESFATSDIQHAYTVDKDSTPVYSKADEVDDEPEAENSAESNEDNGDDFTFPNDLDKQPEAESAPEEAEAVKSDLKPEKAKREPKPKKEPASKRGKKTDPEPEAEPEPEAYEMP